MQEKHVEPMEKGVSVAFSVFQPCGSAHNGDAWSSRMSTFVYIFFCALSLRRGSLIFLISANYQALNLWSSATV
jgi:hypothetical protein